MTEIGQQQLPSEHPADDVWRMLNVPLMGELGRLVNPFVAIEYQDLSDEGLVQRGTLVIYTPDIDALRPALGMATEALPKDVALRVEEQDPLTRSRLDVLESDKHAGTIRHEVRESDSGTGLLVVEGEISLGGSRRMFEGMIASYAERGLAEHSRRTIEHLPAILGRSGSDL